MGLFTIFSKVIASLRGKRDSTSFSINSRRLFEALISTTDDNFNPIQIYSAKELKKATDDYSQPQILMHHGNYTVYKGFLHGRPVSVKKPKPGGNYDNEDDPIMEIVFASVFSSHGNVLKLLGCCLETDLPILVFEYAQHGTLFDRILRDGSQPPLRWKYRLEIAMDLCEAVAYLHNEFPRPIVHRDITPSNIFLDENYAAKLFDFSLSAAIPDGESQAEGQLRGTPGYIAPECWTNWAFNEKADVYSMGVVLLQLLTEQPVNDFGFLGNREEDVLLTARVQRYNEKERVNEIVDSAVWEDEYWPEKEQHFQAFATLALHCLAPTVENRPTMVEMGRQLREMHRFYFLSSVLFPNGC